MGNFWSFCFIEIDEICNRKTKIEQQEDAVDILAIQKKAAPTSIKSVPKFKGRCNRMHPIDVFEIKSTMRNILIIQELQIFVAVKDSGTFRNLCQGLFKEYCL